ncbi:Pyriculol/pyriculariol biosynthesis cluster transcription factor like protein [Verticillium longisporum]|uniref:Pyriculol/pyriculariol biosynthesis cluster transcription factor like protein n=1 Tax=Verticillium longisporum TaxID=100787 RepID=A0A8I3AGS7_VERLO|nr:Pyriculol/pyriculariol biosynthesis cluster transcription factor like protein [Verticillium longisporum]
MKLTRGTSCVLCQQRKVRCDKRKPCANCVKARVECRVVPPNPPRRRKKRLQEKDLIDRLKKYETLLAENGVSVDPIARDLRVSSHGGVDEVTDLENDLEGLHTSPDGSQASSSQTGFGAGTHRPDKTLASP